MESRPIVTLDEVKEFLGSSSRVESTASDARYTRLALLATRQIEQATGRWLTKQQFVEFFTSRDNVRSDYDFAGAGDTYMPYAMESGLKRTINAQTLYLSGVGIDPDAPFDVWYDPSQGGASPFGDGTKLTPGTDYGIDYDEDNVILYIGTRYRPRALKVVYTAGYAETDGSLSGSATEDLKTAVLIQTAFLNVKLRNDNIGMDSERTVSSKDRVHAAPFMARAGLTPEVSSMVGYLKRVRTGRG